jgi:hypothetical protein
MSSLASIALDGIEQDATWVAYYGGSLGRRIALLGTMPDFRTRAEADLDRAETALTEALAVVRKAKRAARPMKLAKAG